MATQVQFRRGTTAETASFIGAVGEITVDTDKNTVVVHDGSTPGGFPLLRQDFNGGFLSPGSLGTPSLKFTNSANTGIYSPAAGTIALVSSGIAALTTDTVGNLATGQTFTATGRVTASSFVPTSSAVPTNGLYLSAANTVAIATNSAVKLTVGPTGDVTVQGNLTVNGTDPLTSSSFVPTSAVAPTNGLYLSAANTIALSTNSALKFSINATGDVTIVGGLSVGGSFNPTAVSPTGSVAPLNGMYLPTADTLGFATGPTTATQRVTISSTGLTVTSGSLSVPSGSASAVNFNATGNTVPANGMYLSAANTISFATNTTQRISIDSSGNVAITGTGTLTVPGSNTSASFIPSGSSIPTNGMYLPSSDTLSFSTASTQRLSISSTGNLTIAGTGTLTVPGTTSSASFIPTGSSVPTNGLYLSAVNTLAFATNSGLKATLDATGNLTVSSGSITTSAGSNTATSFIPTGASIPTNGLYLSAANTLAFATNSGSRVTIDATGNLVVSGGTTSSPSFVPTGSSIPTNGLYLSAANTLAFATNSGSKVTIDATGNLVVSSGAITTSAGSNTATSFIPTGSSVPTNGLYLSAANTLAFATNSGSRVTIDSTGNLTVSSGRVTSASFVPTGSTVPTNGLYLSAANTLAFATNSTLKATISSAGEFTVSSGAVTANGFIPTSSTAVSNGLYLPFVNSIGFSTSGLGRAVIDSDGRFICGADGSVTGSSSSKPRLQSIALSTTTPYFAGAFFGFHNDANPTALQIGHCRGTTISSTATLLDNDGIGLIRFEGTDGTAFRESAAIYAEVSGTVSTGNVPARLSFRTASTTSGGAVERLVIGSGGLVNLTSSSPALRFSGSSSGYVELASPATAASNRLVLPATTGASQQAIVNDGSGNLSFAYNGGSYFYRLLSTTAGANVNTAQGIFDQGVSVSASTVYAFDLFLVMTKTAGTTAHTVSFLFGGTATITNMLYVGTGAFALSASLPLSIDTGTQVATTVMSNSLGATAFTPSIANANAAVCIQLRGTINVNAAGTLIPQYILSAAPGGAYSMRGGTYFRIYQIGVSGGNNIQGPWA